MKLILQMPQEWLLATFHYWKDLNSYLPVPTSQLNLSGEYCVPGSSFPRLSPLKCVAFCGRLSWLECSLHEGQGHVDCEISQHSIFPATSAVSSTLSPTAASEKTANALFLLWCQWGQVASRTLKYASTKKNERDWVNAMCVILQHCWEIPWMGIWILPLPILLSSMS